MCGIAGIANLGGEPVKHELIQRMTDSMIHRGPDGEGSYLNENVALGHRRLAIIDLSDSGYQPMLDNESRFVITYNGEIYNYKDLRKELINLGYCFKSKTDTEVVLAAYAFWGESAIQKLNGMFAVVIYDKLKKELFIARDRYGIKPLYYSFQNNTFLFASEVKAINTHPKVKFGLNRQVLLEYFTFQNVFSDGTLFSNIYLFPAGHTATLSLCDNSQELKPKQYWDFNFIEPDNSVDEREYIEELDRLFKQAVDRQLVSDVELGSYLSGGMDSGSITAIAAQKFSNIKTFTCGFDLHSASGLELNFDEREKAEYMSYLFRTEHYEMVLKAGDMERCMESLTWHLEDPRVGQSYPNFYAAKLASKFVKVVLAGTGGDEIFGGYPWRYYRAVLNENFEDYIDKYYLYWQRLIPNKDIRKVFSPIWHEVKDVWTRDIFRDVFQSHSKHLVRPEDYVNHSLYFESKTFLHGLLLVEDKLSMAHSLESRVPFLDNDLVDFGMKIPVSLKLNKLDEVLRVNENEVGNKPQSYFQKTNDGKLALREMMRKYIPKKITDDIKQGFSAPDCSWFKGDSINYVREKLCSEDNSIYQVLDYASINIMLNEHFSGTRNRRLLIWSLLNFSEWLNKFA